MWTVYFGFLCVSLSLSVLILAGAAWLFSRAADGGPPLAKGERSDDFPRPYRGA